MQADVERAVPAFGEPGESARAARRDRAVPRVDRSHDVAREERLPGALRLDAVRPLLVGEAPGRAERHREDHRPHLVPCDQLVLDDARANGREKRAGPARHAVEQIEHGVAAVRMRAIAGRQVDVDRLATSSERGARDVEAFADAPCASHTPDLVAVRSRGRASSCRRSGTCRAARSRRSRATRARRASCGRTPARTARTCGRSRPLRLTAT